MRYLIIIFLLLFKFKAIAQTPANGTVSITLPIIAIIDIEPVGSISFTFTIPTEAGKPIMPITNNTKWLNYTSAITEGGISKKITAKISELIPGLDIKIKALPFSGQGGGILGVPTNESILNLVSKDIITGIKGAYTGDGQNNGHQLNITLTPNTYSNLRTITNKNILITYTISE